MSKTNSKKAIVGLSGGVDSSTAAGLLVEEGWDVAGVFLEFWGDKNHCCGEKAERRARKICDQLDLPFYKVDVRKEFKKEVVNYFLEGYKKGTTPNPCVVCNRRIKFEVLFNKMQELEADWIATGHYAIAEGQQIYAAQDKMKDQTYFLWNLKDNQLANALFPIGRLTKSQVRERASQMELPTSSLEESQEVCFVEDKLKGFLDKHLDLQPGPIVNKEGQKLGSHQGLPVYTLGQRKGIGLSGGPYYVLEKNLEDNELVVTKEDEDLLQKEVSFKESNFFGNISFPLEVEAKIRYNADRKPGKLTKKHFEFDQAQRAIAPGQSIVFYLGERLLGGGIIKVN